MRSADFRFSANDSLRYFSFEPVVLALTHDATSIPRSGGSEGYYNELASWVIPVLHPMKSVLWYLPQRTANDLPVAETASRLSRRHKIF